MCMKLITRLIDRAYKANSIAKRQRILCKFHKRFRKYAKIVRTISGGYGPHIKYILHIVHHFYEPYNISSTCLS